MQFELKRDRKRSCVEPFAWCETVPLQEPEEEGVCDRVQKDCRPQLAYGEEHEEPACCFVGPDPCQAVNNCGSSTRGATQLWSCALPEQRVGAVRATSARAERKRPWWPGSPEVPRMSTSGRLRQLYVEGLLPLERECCFHQLCSPELSPAFFSARPMVLSIGQYSTGKTSFIRRLLGQDYPGMRIGPEPSTDRFTAISYGESELVTPGHALIYDNDLPFRPLGAFGSGFLSKFEGAQLPNPLLKGMTLVDTPGIVSGEQQAASRGYAFDDVVKWFADHASMVLLFFDVHKVDVLDELESCIAALSENRHKVRIILNKVDQVSMEHLMRVYGALVWSLGRLLDTPEAARVYFSSLVDDATASDERRAFLERERGKLWAHLEQLPLDAPMQRLDSLTRRAHRVRGLAVVLEHLRTSASMSFWGHAARERELLDSLPAIYQQVARERKVPLSDLPDHKVLQASLEQRDLSKLPRLDQRRFQQLEGLLAKDIPLFLEQNAARLGGA